MSITINFIFQNTNDITINHAKWLASFVIDLDLRKMHLKTSNPALNFCNVQNPIHPVNLAKLCIVKLFLQKQEAEK